MGDKEGIHGLPIGALKSFRCRFEKLIWATVRAGGLVVGERLKN
jgi:hypothetical protein